MSLLLDLYIKSPLAIFIVILSLTVSDLVLTFIGYNYSQKKYKVHIRSNIYELNPLNQKLVHNKNTIPVSQLILRLILSILIALLADSYIKIKSNLTHLEFFLGVVTLLYIVVNIRHLKNIYLFIFTKNNPSSLNGHININNSYVYVAHRLEHIGYGVIWFLVFIAIDRSFFLGGALAELLMIPLSIIWEKKSFKNSE